MSQLLRTQPTGFSTDLGKGLFWGGTSRQGTAQSTAPLHHPHHAKRCRDGPERGEEQKECGAAALGPAAVGGRAPPADAGVRSVVAVALAGLVEEAPRALAGPAGRALAGPILPLQRLLAEPRLLGQLLGPLHPPCLADLLQDGGLHRQGCAAVRYVPLQLGLRHLPVGTQDCQRSVAPGAPITQSQHTSRT